ncbi:MULTISPECIES: TolC family protein [unclassified Moritella]|uniref:TolC family protein n=1 Tax=unclassified Moritella TaxID=2637987 RepID=UPI001BA6A960|nr:MULTISPECIES: TolC family protein [unclassified Moritella]QUM86773.1 TolC family protein [Moritella sp. 28]QUM91000.1 TolC family protein [Moritella sp. 36]
MKTVFYGVISAIALSCNVQAAAIDFSEAWYQVVQKNDALQAKKEEVKHSEALQSAAKSLYLPNVDITGSYTHLDKPIEIDTSGVKGKVGAISPIIAGMLPNSVPLSNQNVAHSSLNAVLPIYTGGRITAAQDIREAQVSEAESNYDLATRATFTQLVQYYFGVVLSEQVYQVRLDAVDALADHLNHAIKLEQQGQIAKVERLMAQVSLDKAQIEAQKSLRDYEIAKLALTKMLKQQDSVLPTTPLFVNNSATSVTPYLSKTLTDHPGIAVLNAKREQAKGMVEMAFAKHLPEVMLYGNYNLYSDDSVMGQSVPEWMVGVGVRIPIIERSGTSQEVVAAKSSVRRVNLLQMQMQQDLSILVEKTYAEMSQALEEYNSLASSQALSEETVVLRQKAFSQGLSTSLEMADAQLYATSIRVQRLSASYNYVKSLAQLLSVSGDIDRFMDYLKINGIEVK